MIFGKAPYEDYVSRRIADLDAPMAIQLDDNENDPLIAISAGKDFGLLTTASGKVSLLSVSYTILKCLYSAHKF